MGQYQTSIGFSTFCICRIITTYGLLLVLFSVLLVLMGSFYSSWMRRNIKHLNSFLPVCMVLEWLWLTQWNLGWLWRNCRLITYSHYYTGCCGIATLLWNTDMDRQPCAISDKGNKRRWPSRLIVLMLGLRSRRRQALSKIKDRLLLRFACHWLVD